ncbi:Asp23/Gls24 family envelope stress response protein [Paucilactobacillus sp. N302-9]
MAEETNISLNDDAKKGAIKIAPRVLESISGIAASEVEGVVKMQGSLANSVNELLGRGNHRRGVKLTQDGDQLVIDVAIYLDYGVSVPKIALEIQDRIKQQVSLMTDLKVKEVNVHIEGIIPEKAEQQIDPDDIFDENGNEDQQ